MRAVGMFTLLSLAVVGCGQGSSLNGFDVMLTIRTSPSQLSDADLATITSLTINATNAQSGSKQYPLTRALGRQETLVMRLAVDAGQLGVSVVAYDAAHQIVALGSGTTMLSATSAATAGIDLSPPAAGPHQPHLVVATPVQATLFVGQSAQLGAGDGTTTPVKWSLQEGLPGGTIDDQGNLAPAPTPGTIHAVATSVIFPNESITIPVTVLAGGLAVFSGPVTGGGGTLDGNGGAARITSPAASAFDGSGNLYFTEDDLVLRRLDTKGNVTTIAGQVDSPVVLDGTGSSASFQIPSGVVFDAAANALYVGDNGVLRKVDLASAAVTSIAGINNMFGSVDGPVASATFRGPMSLAYDGNGTLYMGDLFASNIRKLDMKSGMVSTLAGKPTPGYADGPAATAQFQSPSGLVLDGMGKLYVGDGPNHVIRAVDIATGNVTTVAGSQTKIGSSDGVGTAAAFGYPNRIAFDGVQTLWITDGPWRDLNLATLAVTTLTQNGQQVDVRPSTAVSWSAGKLYLSTLSDIEMLDPVSDAVTILAGVTPNTNSIGGPRLAAQWSSPVGLTTGSDGNVYARDGNSFRKIDAAGNVTILGNTNTYYGDNGNIAWGPDGNLYFGDRSGCVVRKIDPKSGMVTVYAGQVDICGGTDGTTATARFQFPTDFAFEGNVMYVSDGGQWTVRAIDMTSGAVSTLVGTAGMGGFADMPGAMARFSDPEGLTGDGNGNLYLADQYNFSIRKIVIATGAVSTLAGTSQMAGFVDGAPGTGKFVRPYRLTIDAARANLYVADFFGDAIRKVDIATGNITTVAGMHGKTQIVPGALPAQLNRPLALTFAPSGDLLVAVQRENALVQIRFP